MFGKKKRKRNREVPYWREDSVVIYQLEERPYIRNQEVDHLQRVNTSNKSPRLEYYQRIKSHQGPRLLLSSRDKLLEQRLLEGVNSDIGNVMTESKRISMTSPEEKIGKRISSRRSTLQNELASNQKRNSNNKPLEELITEVHPRKLSVFREQSGKIPPERMSVFDPLIQTDTALERRRRIILSRITQPGEDHSSEFQELPESNKLSLVYSIKDKPTRTSIRHKPQRASIVLPIEESYNSQRRLSIVKTPDENENFPLTTTHEPVVYAVRRSISKHPRQSFSLKKMFSRKIKTEESHSSDEEENQREQTMYAYPVTPTRGRTGSILQQSVKSLTSQKGETPVAWKSMRRSMDTDVFSSDVKRKSVTLNSPGFVNMERGHGMLVSEILNPITSIFVSDLKDPIPKDPLSKPREFNNWVRPRQNSVRQVVTPKQKKSQVKIAVAPIRTQMQKTKKQYSEYNNNDESSYSDSSDESADSYQPRSKYSQQKKPVHRVYAASMPATVLPYHKKEEEKEVGVNNLGNTPSKHLLNRCEGGETIKLTQPAYVGRLSFEEQTNILNTLDFLCHPPVDNLKDIS